jgi:ceramide glucosyltransferase
VSQPVGRRDSASVWKRQVRWARLRRTGYPWIYAAELLAWPIVPIVAGIGLAAGGSIPGWAVAAFAAAWYAIEAAFTIVTRLPFSATMPLAWLVRDYFIIPVTWVLGWTSTSAEWRGAKISVARPRS